MRVILGLEWFIRGIVQLRWKLKAFSPDTTSSKAMENNPSWSEEKNIEYFNDFWAEVGKRFYGSVPLFSEIRNDLILLHGAKNPPEHPISQLVSYVSALAKTGTEIAYSEMQMAAWCKHPDMWTGKTGHNVLIFYANHYLSDFLMRVKLSTDLLALIINHIFGFEFTPERCNLEKRRFTKPLGDLKAKRTDKSWELISELINKLNRAAEWLEPLAEVRNDVIHRGKLEFVGSHDEHGRTTIALRITIPSGTSCYFPPRNPRTGFPIDDDGNPLLPVHALRYLVVPPPTHTIEDIIHDTEVMQQVYNPKTIGSIEDKADYHLEKFLLKIDSKSVLDHLMVADPSILCGEIWDRVVKLIEDVFRLLNSDIKDFTAHMNALEGK